MSLIQKALKVMESEFKERGDSFSNSDDVKIFCRLAVGNEPDEVFGVLFLDNKNRLICFEKMFRGTIATSNVYLRPIVRKMFELNAAKIIITHNHPSGDCTPSDCDLSLTKELQSVLKKLDCRVLDHIIVSPINSISLRQTQQMK